MPGTRVTAIEVDASPDGEAEEIVIEDNYVLVCDGTCHQHSVVRHANGTHVITVKGIRT